MKDVPEFNSGTMKRLEDMTWFTHAQIFEDLMVVAQKETACYIWKTSEGLVVIDGIWPDKRVYNEILIAIKNAGWEDEKITKFIITHGHIDHVGCGKWLVENHDIDTYLSKSDDELRVSTSHKDGHSDSWKEFNIDVHIGDGDIIFCGDKSIQVVATPGHTVGCMSFFFPVYDLGEKHMAGLFGGAVIPSGDEARKLLQKRSVAKFMDVAKSCNCDVALSNHTAFDNGLARIEYSRSRMSHLPNIYILGEAGVQKFCEAYIRIVERN
ncbi:MAG: MBL fold metallo-hydrolase [Lentihominibacter sp.]|jgi:metallo-beta-lactamase class B